MAIATAEIEANGWVLRLTLAGAPGDFASYALDPDGSPRVVLDCQHPGHERSGGQAVFGTHTRSIIATRPLRLPVNPASPTVKIIDEENLGGGQLRVRLALSQTIYASETGVSLNVAAGWRSGAPAQAGIAVANGSAIPAPIPIMRWARPSYEISGGVFRASLLVASHHPLGFAAVAGVRFTATDGVTTREAWATAMGTDDDWGDALRCWTVQFDGTAAPALGAGLIRVDAEVFPWLGAMRSTDPAGTRSMASLRSDGWRADAASPLVVGLDPAGTRYGQMWAYVDPVNGTATASATMVQASLAAAKAVAPAARPRDVNTARQAGYLFNRTLPAANGQAAQTRSVDGMRIVLAPGVHAAHGATAVTTGIAEAEIACFIMGDPDDPDPRANVVLETSVNQVASRALRLRYQQMTIRLGGSALLGPTARTWFDRVTMQGRAGFETATTGVGTGAPAAGEFNFTGTGCRYWRYGAALPSGNPRGGLWRAMAHAGPLSGLAYVGNRWISAAEDGFVGAAVRGAQIAWGAPTLPAQAEDIITWGCDYRHTRGNVLQFGQLSAAIAGTPNTSVRRQAVIGNLFERVGSDPGPFFSMGENTSATMSGNIFEANSFVGERANMLYSDPAPATLADCDAQSNQAWNNRVANNSFDWLPTKHDDFYDSSTNALRVASGLPAEIAKSGYRPQLVEAWSFLHGVDCEANVDNWRPPAASATFPLEYYGLRSLYTGAALAPGYTADASVAGTGAGGGNYAPLPGSPLLGRVLRGNSDQDLAGAARTGASAAGAFAGPVSAGSSSLAPVAARSVQLAASPALGWAGTLGPQSARSGHVAGAALVASGVVMLPAPALMVQRSGATLLSIPGVLAPAGSGHAISDGGALPILPGFDPARLPMLRVNADVRLLSVRAPSNPF